MRLMLIYKNCTLPTIHLGPAGQGAGLGLVMIMMMMMMITT